MKLVSLVSSGIDSPVATYLLSKYTEEIILVHGDNRPYTDDQELANFTDIARQLKTILECQLKVYSIPYGEDLSVYQQYCTPRFTCVFCKRMLVRYAEGIARKVEAEALVMGDSLGQVASQTLQNIQVVENATSLPILRPLIGFDKEEIITIAKQIGTYDLSIQQTTGCSAVPKKPATRARLLQIFEEEKKLDINKMISNTLSKATLLSL
jgi:thiamine biosynthesis protein ThiI